MTNIEHITVKLHGWKQFHSPCVLLFFLTAYLYGFSFHRIGIFHCKIVFIRFL